MIAVAQIQSRTKGLILPAVQWCCVPRWVPHLGAGQGQHILAGPQGKEQRARVRAPGLVAPPCSCQPARGSECVQTSLFRTPPWVLTSNLSELGQPATSCAPTLFTQHTAEMGCRTLQGQQRCQVGTVLSGCHLCTSLHAEAVCSQDGALPTQGTLGLHCPQGADQTLLKLMEQLLRDATSDLEGQIWAH